MNNVYNPTGIYSIRGDMCYDNKVMMNTAHSEGTNQKVVLNISDREPQSQSQHNVPTKSRFRQRIRLRVPLVNNVIITIVAISLLLLLELGILPGTKLGFICNDPLISQPYRGDTISPTTLLVGSFLGPLLVITFVELLIEKSFRRIAVKEVWFYYKECAVGCTVVLLITEIAKIIVGEHRPHFIDVCQPDTNKHCVNGTFVETYTCTNAQYSHYFLTDTSRSFPSGHSSVSVFVSLYCAYIIQVRLPTVVTGALMKPFLVCACLTWGLLCSLSRITDRRHHWWDVLAGMSLGALGAYYTLYLLHKKNCVDELPRNSTSTTTLLDAKNKDATSIVL